MMNWSIEQKTRLTFVLVILLVILIGFFSYRSTINFITANQSVTHTRAVLDELQGTLSSIQDVQAAQLAYLLTGNAIYLDHYNALNGLVAQHLTALRNLTLDEPTQQDRLDNLEPAVTRWLALIAQAIRTQEQSGAEQARTLISGVQTSTLMAQIRTFLSAMTSDEQTLLAQNRLTQAAQRDQSTLATFAILTLLMVGLLSFGYTRIHRNLVARHRAEQLLQQERALLRAVIDTLPDYIYVKDTNLRLVLANRAHIELVGGKSFDEVMGKTDTDLFPGALASEYIADEKVILQSGIPLVNHEEPTTSSNGDQKIVLTTKMPIRNTTGEITQIVGISHDITARKQAEEEINLLNQNLRLQSAKLETANKELEAFSYSVSHDLRAPLRAIDGFSRILMDDHSANLPPEAIRYLEKVRTNARHMGALIDDLLRFSRLSRQSIIKQKIQPAGLVRQVLDDDLRGDRENRQVEITVGDLPACNADPLLLRQVYVNLLSNALKFTCKQDYARIEVGSRQDNGDVVYFVKDNGAGFDQQYVHKLFGVFQRLHRAEDYEGTGVGLAIVQRVINRHGGRIWAEGAVDAGAAFFFTFGGNKGDKSRCNTARGT
jgi:PAS domain S-box-containing protein